MNFFNKILLNTWSFKFPNFIMFVQLLSTAIFIKCAKLKGYLSWVEEYTIQNAKKCALVSAIFCEYGASIVGTRRYEYSDVQRSSTMRADRNSDAVAMLHST